jgi:hypothetical protein
VAWLWAAVSEEVGVYLHFFFFFDHFTFFFAFWCARPGPPAASASLPLLYAVSREKKTTGVGSFAGHPPKDENPFNIQTK